MPIFGTKGAASAQSFGLCSQQSVPDFMAALFSTWLYTGNGSTQTINNGLDMTGKGGLTWIKSRSNATDNKLVDTARGATNALVTSNLNAQTTDSSGLTAFGSTGFSLGSDSVYNSSGATYASWSFCEQSKFFDIVTYTGDGSSGRTVSHNLGSAPGCMIVKNESGGAWVVYHRTLGGFKFLLMNGTNAEASSATAWNNTDPTSTVFTLGNAIATNGSGQSIVAYLFADNAGGFGPSGTDNAISCGSYTGNGTSGVAVTLGYEPQWLLIKRTDTTGDWVILDTERGMPSSGADPALYPNSSSAEVTGSAGYPTSTGFYMDGSWSDVNSPGGNYVYVAIRRGN